MIVRSLYGRLAAVLLALVSAMSVGYVLLTVFATEMYQQEVAQKLDRDLARHIVAERLPMEDGRVDEAALDSIFHMLMVINPRIEIYLLDTSGRILAFSAPPERVVRRTVDLRPVRRFLRGEAEYPLLGDDPRSPGRRKVFSVAAVPPTGPTQGYLYVVLQSQDYDTIAQVLRGSYILRLSVEAIALGTIAVLAAGLLTFHLLTRRLGQLSQRMNQFRQSDFSSPPGLRARRATGHEIDQLETAFEDLAGRIVEQVERLRQTDALRRELVANVSHDLRTPLATLRGYVETLLIKEPSLTAAERRQFLEIASKQSERLGRLVEELFELAKLDSRETVPHTEPFAISELVQDVAQKFRLQADARGVQIDTDVRPAAGFVHGDIGLIERVLDNLLDNALRHSATPIRVEPCVSAWPPRPRRCACR